MNKIMFILLIVLVVVIGLLTGLFIGNVAQLLQPAISIAQPTFTKLQNLLSSIPSSLVAVVVGGASTLFTIFFAWSKSRAMQQLQETKQQAISQFTQLEGEKSEAEQQIKTLQEQKKGLQDQIAEIPSNYTDKLTSLRDEVTRKEQQIQEEIRRRNELEATYKNLIEELKLKEKVIVK